MSMRARLGAAQRQLGGVHGPVQIWVVAGDGFARCGDLVMTEREFIEQHGTYGAFTLRLGDHDLQEST
jgi:hypothetical protein